jgi:hypothetical protein
MKAVTIQQPFASLIVAGIKTLECRTWPTDHRGPLVIHVGKQSTMPHDLIVAGYKLLAGIGISPGTAEQLRGKIIGQVTVTACMRADIADHLITADDNRVGIFNAQTYVWVLRQPIEYQDPISCSGQQGIWEITSAIQKKAELASSVLH